MGRHSAGKTRWPVSAGGFPVAPRSRYRTPAAAATTAVSGALGLTMIVVAASASLISQGQQVHGVALAAPAPVGLALTKIPVPQNSPVTTAPTTTTPTTGEPTRTSQRPVTAPRANTVLLPKGGVAELVRSPVSGDGTLQVPNGVTQAALWGAALDAPAGATLVAGHINWGGVPGPFAELWGAQQGQIVSIVDSGRTLRFTVTNVLTVDKNTLPQHAEELFGQTGPHRLVLVTCGGQWVGGALGYDQNRVVIATPLA